jgi:transposase-like protein
MARMMDATKRKLWGERFRRFDGCDLTVADFCLAEGVSTPSFYQWRRKLRRLRTRESAPVQEPAFLPVRLLSPKPAATAVEIRLPNGAQVTVMITDAQTMAAAIVAAGQARSIDEQQEESEC